MPKVSDMRESKFLKQSDVGQEYGSLLTVRACNTHNVAKEGAEAENKWCLEFEETDKPLVLNSTNIQLCVLIFGSDNTDDWNGQRLVLYVDPAVSYGGKVTGGIRVRAPKKTAQAAAKQAPVVEMTDQDVPF
jgi:hypothetical protein